MAQPQVYNVLLIYFNTLILGQTESISLPYYVLLLHPPLIQAIVVGTDSQSLK